MMYNNTNNDNNNDIAFQLKPDVAICQKAILVHVGKHVKVILESLI